MKGDNETGVSFYSVSDSLELIDSERVEIIINDTGADVYAKQLDAVETLLARAVPAVLRGGLEYSLVNPSSDADNLSPLKDTHRRIDWGRRTIEIT